MSSTDLVWYAQPIFFGLSAAQLWLVFGPIVSAFIASFATHHLTRRRDRENHRLRLEEEAKVAARRVRRERLLEAYRALDASEPQRVSFRGLDNASYEQLLTERAAAYSDINLFGDESLAKEIDMIVEKGAEYDTSRIMNLLRDFLRKEYGLEPTRARYKWIEVTLNKPSDKKTGEAQ